MKFAYQRWLIKGAMFWLISGTLAGALLYVGSVSGLALPALLRTSHVHILTVGFLLQLIMGVALWMFPRLKDEPRYTPEWQGFLLFGLLNSGVALRSLPVLGAPAWAGHAGALLQVFAVVCFVATVVGRIRAP